MGNPVAYLKMHFGDENAPLAVIMREDNEHLMFGFLVKVTYMEQRQRGKHRLLVKGVGRFVASKVFKNAAQLPNRQEERKQQEDIEVWVAEG